MQGIPGPRSAVVTFCVVITRVCVETLESQVFFFRLFQPCFLLVWDCNLPHRGALVIYIRLMN